MASSRPVRVGSASHTFKKNDPVNARETHIYRTTEEITVARVYEEDESGYAGIEGTFLDGSNAEQVIHAILPDKFVQANSNLYETHQRLTELYLEERFKGTVILCSGTMTMTLLASGPRIKKYFAMEVKDAHVVSEPPQVTRPIQKDIFPTVKIYKKGGIRAQLDLAYPKSSKTHSPPSPRASRERKRYHQHPGSDTESDHNGQGGATTPEAQEVEALAREMTRSLSTSGDLPLAHGLTDEQIATLKQQEWQPSHGIQPFTSPWSSLKNPTPVSDTTSIIDRLRPIPTAPASPLKKTATMFKDDNRPTMTSSQGSQDLDVPLARRRATLAKPQSPLKATAPQDPLGDFPVPSGLLTSSSSSSSSSSTKRSTKHSTKPTMTHSTSSTKRSTKPTARSTASTAGPPKPTTRSTPSTAGSTKPTTPSNQKR
ncbi:MAG: hypothetical protein JOS17DRAFT_823308 [Linnemannia elongata]|nr:MAG: hypothetical protein JOS17DRAFT_823308 [Linnemannia elongata]